MIEQLKWGTLQQRRNTSDVILMYKIVNNLIAIPQLYHPTPAIVQSTRNSHQLKFQTIRGNITAYQRLFFPRCIILWNQLPPGTVTVPDLDAFKAAVRG